MINCIFCNKQFKNYSGAFAQHLLKYHNITSKEYYDKFLLKNEENVCIICGNESKFFGIGGGYNDICSCKKCIYKKIELNNLKKYGVKYIPQLKTVKQKVKQTKLEKYDDPNYNNVEKNKETKLKNHGNENYNNRDGSKATKLKNHGDENYNNRDGSKATKLKNHGDENYNNRGKSKETCIKKYGVGNPSQSNDIKIKTKNMMLDKYGVEHHTKLKYIQINKINTCKEKYGVEHVMHLDIIKEKVKETKLDRYGDENYVNMEKNRETKLDRYGDPNYNNREKFKETNLNMFGVENPMQNEEVKNKSKQTCLAKYGVENPMQNEEIFNKVLKSLYSAKDYVLPSGKIARIRGYEPFALNHLLNIYTEDEIVYQTKLMPKIWYIDNDGKKHIYFPDFYIPKDNLIIEVKSDYTYNKDLEVNLLKKEAVIDSGYNYRFMIFKPNGELLNILDLIK